MHERDLIRRAAAAEVRHALARLDMTWREWRAASESGHYFVVLRGLPCARSVACRHALAWLLGRN